MRCLFCDSVVVEAWTVTCKVGSFLLGTITVGICVDRLLWHVPWPEYVLHRSQQRVCAFEVAKDLSIV